MNITEHKVRRLTLTKEEKEISKSWGPLWARFGALERKGKPIYLIFGDWSGYRSSQYRITHIDAALSHYRKVEDFRLGTVQFTDGTSMAVWVKSVTREQIINHKWRRSPSYTQLINKLIDSGKTFYQV